MRHIIIVKWMLFKNSKMQLWQKILQKTLSFILATQDHFRDFSPRGVNFTQKKYKFIRLFGEVSYAIVNF